MGTWAHQPVAVDSCGAMTPTGECAAYHVCASGGECTQNQAFCDNAPDSLLIEAQDVFGDDAGVTVGDCPAALGALRALEECVAAECAGNWSCAEMANHPCNEHGLSCMDSSSCAQKLECLSGCQDDAGCVEGCLPQGADGFIGTCIANNYQEQLLLSEGCAGCFGGFVNCMGVDCFNACVDDANQADEACVDNCQQNQCSPAFFDCLGPVQFLCDSYCGSVECGEDWCGGSCGTCGDGATCQADANCQCDCAETTCVSQGFECGAFVCDNATCDADGSGCGALNDPWTAWNADGSGLTGGQVANEVIPVVGAETGAVANNGAASPTWSVIRVGDGGMVGSPPYEMLETGVLTFDISGIPQGAVIESALLRMYQGKVVGELPFEADGYVHVGVQHIRFEGFWWDAVVNTTPIGATGTESAPYILSNNPAIGWKNVEIAPALRYELATCQEQLQLRVMWLPEMIGDGTQQSNQVHFNSDDAKDNNPALTVSYRLGGTPEKETDAPVGEGGAN